MARYINYVETALAGEELNKAVYEKMTKKGFKQKTRDGEKVWQKGGALVAPQFVKVTEENNKAKVEGWLKFSLLPGIYYGEMDLTGTMGFAIKNALRKTIAELESALKG